MPFAVMFRGEVPEILARRVLGKLTQNPEQLFTTNKGNDWCLGPNLRQGQIYYTPESQSSETSEKESTTESTNKAFTVWAGRWSSTMSLCACVFESRLVVAGTPSWKAAIRL